MFNITPIKFVEEFVDRSHSLVSLNGIYIGLVESGAKLHAEMMQAKSYQKISKYISIKCDPM